VATFLLEVFSPPTASRGELIERLRSAASDLTDEGTPVRYLRSIYLPTDEVSFHLLEGPSLDAVERAGAQAGLSFDRIVEAIA
jgi:hypothetical protein